MVQGSAKQFSMGDVMDLKHSLSFSLTNDQNRVVEEILQDLSSDKVMYRMVQGDVGCGKTMVAAFACMPVCWHISRRFSWHPRKFLPSSILQI